MTVSRRGLEFLGTAAAPCGLEILGPSRLGALPAGLSLSPRTIGAALILTMLGGLAAACTPPMVEQVTKACAGAADVTACQDAEYAHFYAIERAKLRLTY